MTQSELLFDHILVIELAQMLAFKDIGFLMTPLTGYQILDVLNFTAKYILSKSLEFCPHGVAQIT